MRFLRNYAENHPDLTRRVLTQAATIGTKRMIVFLTPGYEARNGGVMAIAAYYRESMALSRLHRARVILCTVPGDPPFLKYTWFENDNYILNLEDVLRNCQTLNYLLIHIPAVQVDRVLDWLGAVGSNLISNIKHVQLNILVMNIDNIRGKNVAGLSRYGEVTCITAHESYSNSDTRAYMGVPLHRLSILCGPEFYTVSRYQKKKSLLIVSPDEHPMKQEILSEISNKNPDISVVVINNLSYNAYRELASQAKWSLTFGEGLDFYFVEPVFSGGLSFSVFNERYFTPEFADLENVYPTWEELRDKLPGDLQRLDEPEIYSQCWRKTYDLAKSLYNVAEFRENLRKFYNKEYTFP